MAYLFSMEIIKSFRKELILPLFLIITVLIDQINSESEEGGGVTSGNGQRFKLEGKVINQHTSDQNWVLNARVLVDGGEYLGMIKADGTFVVSNVPSGSYIVEVSHPKFLFEPARVEINSKGKIRARALNNIQPSVVSNLNYPLKFRSRGRPPYFQQREQWRLSDVVFNPMILMMFMPLMMMFVLPKLMNSQDPETQKEMQKSMSFLNPKQNMPDVSEWLTQMFKGGGTSVSSSTAIKKSSKNKSSKKQQ